MEIKITIEGKDYLLEIKETGDKTKISVNGKDFFFEKDKNSENFKQIAPAAQANLPRRDFSAKTVKAPLAGIIGEVFVKAGDIIKAGQKLLTLSAMKMENEIVAECEGKIKEIKAQTNQKVKEGDVLIIIK